MTTNDEPEDERTFSHPNGEGDEDDDDYLTLSVSFCSRRAHTSAPAAFTAAREQRFFSIPSPLQLPPSHPLYVPPPQRLLSLPENTYLCLGSTSHVQSQSPSCSYNESERKPHADCDQSQHKKPLQEGGTKKPRRPRGRTRHRNLKQARGQGDSGSPETIPPPYPWATEYPARVPTLENLLSKGIHTITGEVQCKRCEKKFNMGFDLGKEFHRIKLYALENWSLMDDRAPETWMQPELRNCEDCRQEKCVKPVIPGDNTAINWLFLFLGEMIGCCTLDQLKYFCKYTKKHRTGAKNRLVYLVYEEMCCQLEGKKVFGR